jgi:hypothetical protein
MSVSLIYDDVCLDAMAWFIPYLTVMRGLDPRI